RVVFEYCLIKGVNDADEDVDRLKKLTHNLLCHVNVICLNPNGGPLKATTKQEAYAFVEKLNAAGVSATLRRSQGSDIEGACGMLRAKTLKEKQ
ncbi:MAG: 23S rRNA (adenine(2503)-C(2))-methyltransferase RlmN, partial [Clostridia bacterium]|nr:23S rRNA (adenine(2503)-C(2))-methyltransferase RlmN [Clostridia bacterium]